MPNSSNPQLIGSLTRGLTILELLQENGSMGVSELGRAIGVNKSSAYRLLSTLEARGYVEQVSESGKYRLGMKLAGFRIRVLTDSELIRAAKPCLRTLSEQTGEAAGLCILNGGSGLLVDKYTGPQRIVANLTEGMREPLYCTALGKMLLSSLPPERQRAILTESDLVKRTAHTVTDSEKLLEELVAISHKGFAVDDEEYDAGVRCVAAPVYDYTKTMVASIGISGPAGRLTERQFEEDIRLTKEAAHTLSVRLGL